MHHWHSLSDRCTFTAEEQVAQLTQQCQQQCETLKQREDEIAQLRAEIQGWQETANAAIKERDFVMSKLQEVEQVYQENEADPEQLKHHLRNILYVDQSLSLCLSRYLLSSSSFDRLPCAKDVHKR